MDATRRSGQIFTFYSYKGGTGRSMALANVAWILAAARKRVLVIDWDLEAPGLHRYFSPFLIDKELTGTDGLVEFLIDYCDQALKVLDGDAPKTTEWMEPLADIKRVAISVHIPEFPAGGYIDFVPAGRQSSTYATRIATFNYQHFYDAMGGGTFLEVVKRKMKESYDYVLIDSRTGVADTAGICTVQMPDALAVMFTYNNQSIEGALAVAKSAVAGRSRDRNAFGGAGLRLLSVPTRVDQAEQTLLRRRQLFASTRFAPLLEHLSGTDRQSYWSSVEIPYIPYLAYEETLATLTDDPDDPKKPLAAMVQLTRHLTHGAVSEYRLAIDPARRRQILEQFAQTGLPDPVEAPAVAGGESELERDVRVADSVLGQLRADQQNNAETLWLELARMPEGFEPPGLKRLRVSAAQLPENLHEVLHRFVDAGIVRVVDDSSSGAVFYEAKSNDFLQRWRWLQQLTATHELFLRWRQLVRSSMERWGRAGRPSNQLLHGALAAQGRAWLEEGKLAPDLREYVEKSLQAAAGESSLSLRRAVGTLAAALVVFLCGVLVSWVWMNGRIDRKDEQLSAADVRIGAAEGERDAAVAGLQLRNDLLQASGFLVSGWKALREESYEDALEAFSEAVKLDSTNADGYLGLGDVYAALVMDSEAVGVYEQAKAADESRAETYMKLGQSYARLKRYDAARTSFQRVVDLNPNAQDVKTAKAQLQRLTSQRPLVGTVYLNFIDGRDRDLVANLATALRKRGYRVPGIEQRFEKTTGDVRYGNESDQKLATDVRNLLVKELRKLRIPLSLQLINIGSRFTQVPIGTIEVWIPALPTETPNQRTTILDLLQKQQALAPEKQ